MKKPTIEGLALTETLYGDCNGVTVSDNLANPTDTVNIFGPPSLTPGIKYPISEREERIRELAYNQGYSDSMRMNRAGRLVENDPFLDILRKRMEEIRKDGIRKGRIKPVTKEERALL